MLTLQELKKMLEIPEEEDRLPTAKQLRKSGTAIVDKKLGTDAEICVYQGGYVIYRVCGHSTVFPVHLCGDYLYSCGGSTIHLPERFFEKEKWYLRLVLEGEDRLNRNQEERERKISYSSASEEWSVMEDLAESASEYLQRQETVKEMLQILTEKQRMVVWKYYIQEKTQMQISEELGISRLAVRDLMVHAVNRIRKKYALENSRTNHRARCGEGV